MTRLPPRHAWDLSSGHGVPAPALAPNDGLTGSMSTTGTAVLVVWLNTGMPRRDFSPGLAPATTSNPICRVPGPMATLTPRKD